MRRAYTFTLFLFVILCVIIVAVIVKDRLHAGNESQSQSAVAYSCGKYAEGHALFGTKAVTLEIADTDCKLALGLSGRNSLATDTGMLFVFPKAGNYGFWMKDMRFPLDIVWIGSDFRVSGMEKMAEPESFPAVFGQKYLATYVIELPAGFLDEHSVKVGNKIVFQEKIL